MAGSSKRNRGMISGINVTPLVDITLVLLLVFMVTAKFIVNPALSLDLPSASQGDEVQTVFSVALDKNGNLKVDGEAVTEAQLTSKASLALEEEPELRAVIQADGDARHRQVIDAMDALKEAGITRVAFATEREAADTGSGDNDGATPNEPEASEEGRETISNE